MRKTCEEKISDTFIYSFSVSYRTYPFSSFSFPFFFFFCQCLLNTLCLWKICNFLINFPKLMTFCSGTHVTGVNINEYQITRGTVSNSSLVFFFFGKDSSLVYGF